MGWRTLSTAVVVVAIAAATGFASAGLCRLRRNGPTTSVHLAVGKTYTARLPQPKVAGRVWRIARAFNGKVVNETREGATKQQVWVTFRAVGKGSTKVVFAITRGETPHAYAAQTFSFKVG